MDREKVIKGLEICSDCGFCESIKKFDLRCPYRNNDGKGCDRSQLLMDALALLKEQEGLLGIQQTADSITFVSTGTAQQGEERGIMLGKSWMHEWLKKELLHRGLLTDEIRSVFDEVKRI